MLYGIFAGGIQKHTKTSQMNQTFIALTINYETIFHQRLTSAVR